MHNRSTLLEIIFLPVYLILTCIALFSIPYNLNRFFIFFGIMGISGIVFTFTWCWIRDKEDEQEQENCARSEDKPLI